MDVQKLQQTLIKHEGLRLKPYVDTVGKITIGVGHNLTDNGLTASQVMNLLNDDIGGVLDFITKNCPWFGNLNDARQRAITDMVFNLGGPGFLKFQTLINSIQALNWKEASDSILESEYAKQVGQRAKDNAYMILTGEDPHG